MTRASLILPCLQADHVVYAGAAYNDEIGVFQSLCQAIVRVRREEPNDRDPLPLGHVV